MSSSSAARVRFVRAWLSELLLAAEEQVEGQAASGVAAPAAVVPSWEVTAASVSALTELAERSRCRSADLAALEALLHAQTDELGHEADRLERVLERVGLMHGPQDPSSQFALTLAECSRLLGADDAADADENALLAAAAALKVRAARIPADDASRQRQIKRLQASNLSLYARVCRGEAAERAAEERAKVNAVDDKEKAKKIKFYEQKGNEYAAEAEKLENVLRRSGFGRAGGGGDDKSCATHDSVAATAAELQRLRGELRPLREKLDGYRALPPSLALARARVAEAQGELDALEDELTEQIQELHI